MELIIHERPRSSYVWAGACLLIGLAAGGPFSLFGLFLLAGAAVLGIRAVRSSQGKEALRIDDEGFTFRTVFGQTRESWADIETFKVLTYSYLGIIPIRRVVVYRYVKGRRQGALRKATGWINGWDVQLPGNFGMKARELAGLLEQCRVQASAEVPRAKAS